MQSSRSRYNHIQPNSPMDMLMASTQAGMASMRRAINQHKEDERITKSMCSYCGKDGGGSLKGCSRCKAARYCNQECQLAHFKARHKRECANFAQPPTTSAFITKALPGEQYPQCPVFAQAHEDGVGCWVSVAGRIDCDLQPLTASIDPLKQRTRQEKLMKDGDVASRNTIRTHKAAARSLLGLHVLVQNRRRDKEPVLLYASRAQAVSQPSLTGAVLRGTAQGDNLVKFTKDKISRAAIGVADDPWDQAPRLEIKSINGVEIKKGAPLPSQIQDDKTGTLLLNTGDYAIMHMQFRVGDGDNVSKDWEALSCLESLCFPWVSWDGSTPHASLASSLPTAQSPILSADNTGSSSAAPGHLLRAPINQPMVRAHYKDFIEHGEEAYLRSHYGDARAEMSRSADGMMEMMSELLLGQVAQAGNTDVLVQRLRDCGLADLADKVAAR
ncbi:hypothetical protein PYCCODRAFT_1383571 [Trametes coccinea BRFM310]|uniref:MYND-type domain-containing protein n=1 Tax=Trametes coccinea (strain BRFM310) TaxID=1353009 RepID=A0A1Y2IZI5_TRAC3|nr:hypothetical protein PYCCODRAFT_1383571 [Trametes coccinea BRFM310]